MPALPMSTSVTTAAMNQRVMGTTVALMIHESVTISYVHLVLAHGYGIDRGQQLPHGAVVPQPSRCSLLARCNALLSRVGQNNHARCANFSPEGREVIDVGDHEGVGRPM